MLVGRGTRRGPTHLLTIRCLSRIQVPTAAATALVDAATTAGAATTVPTAACAAVVTVGVGTHAHQEAWYVIPVAAPRLEQTTSALVGAAALSTATTDPTGVEASACIVAVGPTSAGHAEDGFIEPNGTCAPAAGAMVGATISSATIRGGRAMSLHIDAVAALADQDMERTGLLGRIGKLRSSATSASTAGPVSTSGATAHGDRERTVYVRLINGDTLNSATVSEGCRTLSCRTAVGCRFDCATDVEFADPCRTRPVRRAGRVIWGMEHRVGLLVAGIGRANMSVIKRGWGTGDTARLSITGFAPVTEEPIIAGHGFDTHLARTIAARIAQRAGVTIVTDRCVRDIGASCHRIAAIIRTGIVISAHDLLGGDTGAVCTDRGAGAGVIIITITFVQCEYAIAALAGLVGAWIAVIAGKKLSGVARTLAARIAHRAGVGVRTPDRVVDVNTP